MTLNGAPPQKSPLNGLRRLAAAIALVAAATALSPADAQILRKPEVVEQTQLIRPGDANPLKGSFDVSKTAAAATLKAFSGPSGYRRTPRLTSSDVAGTEAKRIEVAFDEVTQPGLYQAVVGGVGKDGADVQVRLQATYTPRLTLSETDVSMQLANCRFCELTRLFAPATARPTRQLQITNTSPTEILANLSIVRAGAAAGNLIGVSKGGGACTQSVSLPIGAGKSETVTLTALPRAPDHAPCEHGPRSDFPDAGEYRAKIVVTARPSTAGVPDPGLLTATSTAFGFQNELAQDVQAHLRVRDGVIPVILLVVLGVIAGRLLTRIKAPGYEEKLDLYGRLTLIGETIERIPDAVAQRLLEALRSALVESVTGEAAVANVAESVRQLGQQANEALRAAELKVEITTALQAEPGNLDLQTALADVQQALELLVRPTPDFTNARIKYHGALAVMAGHGSAAASAALAKIPSPESPAGEPQQQQPHRHWIGAMKVLSVLSGTGEAGVRAYHIIRSLLFLLMLVVLCLYGVWVHYGADSAATFGSAGLAAYATLFLWGLTAEVVNHTLQTITFGDRR